MLAAFLRESAADISSLPQSVVMIQLLAYSFSAWFGKPGDIDDSGFLCPKKTVQLLVNIAMEPFLIPLFLIAILYPSRIVCLISHVTPRLFPNPVRILCLVTSKHFSVPISPVCRKHRTHSH